jgi:hypothetical protein
MKEILRVKTNPVIHHGDKESPGFFKPGLILQLSLQGLPQARIILPGLHKH